MILPPRPRFQLILWAQLIGFLMIISGMFPYWIHKGGAKVPATISWRAGVMAIVVLAMFILPQLPTLYNSIKEMGSEELARDDKLGDNAAIVRQFIWYYCLVDLALLTYLVHVTGGITGSMYAGLYLLVPSLALLLILGSSDLRKAIYLILLSVAGIVGSFLMSHYGNVEYDASNAKHAFDIALLLVTIEGIALLLVQVLVLKYQFEKIERAQVNTQAPTAETQA